MGESRSLSFVPEESAPVSSPQSRPAPCPREKSLCLGEKYRLSGVARSCSMLDVPHLRDVGRGPRFNVGVEFAPNLGGWNDLEDS